MKSILLTCFVLATTFGFSKGEKDIIVEIDSINSQALNYYNNNEIVNALNSIIKAKQLSESISDSYGTALSNFTQGRIYSSIQEFDAAEGRFMVSLRAAKKINDNYLIANTYLNLGRLNKQKKLFSIEHSYLEKALKYASLGEIKDHNNNDKQFQILFQIHLEMSQVYLETNLLEKALIYLLRAEDNMKRYSADSNSLGYYNYTFGLYFIKKDLFNNAIAKFQNALTILEGDKNINSQDNLLLLINTYEKLALALSEENLNKEAYNIILKYNSYKDIFNKETKEEQLFIANSKLLIEDYKKDAQIANTERIEQVQIANQVKNINFIISITLLLFLVLLIALYKNYVSKRKLSHILKVQNVHLEHARNEAEKSSKLKSKFISNVTHELRTPLYGVVGITSLLLENNDLSERDNKFLNSLKYSGDYLLNLINDILHVSKIESQNIELKNTSVSLKKLITNIVDSFNYKLQETNNKIQVSIDSLLPDQIKCDNVRLSQVLINLIGNSIKFTESGDINLRVKLINLNADTVNMRFEIEDTGCGIPEHKFDTIFENFSQLDENININYQGTGLGLSITKNLVELFGSEIELSSKVGVGSTFSFNVSFEIDKTVINNIKKESLVKTIPLKESYRILIAEDNKINQIVTQNLLKKNNFKSVIVGNGLEAVETLKTENFDLILMDINMPIMDGYEATQAIRKFNSEIPIVALTASDIESMRKDIENNGFNDIISKPFDNYEFFQVIESNIERSKSNIYNSKLEKVS